MQSLIVALVVIACTAYAVWTLMPGAARRSLAGSMLKLALLNERQNRRANGNESRLTIKLRNAAQATSGCACDGCDRAPKIASKAASKVAPEAAQVPGAGNTKVITFHPRIRR